MNSQRGGSEPVGPKAIGVSVKRTFVADGSTADQYTGVDKVMRMKGMAHWDCFLEFDDGTRRFMDYISPVEPTFEKLKKDFETNPKGWGTGKAP